MRSLKKHLPFVAFGVAVAVLWAAGATYVNYQNRQALLQRLAEFSTRHPDMAAQAKTLATCTSTWRAAVSDCGKDLFDAHGEEVLTTLFVMQTEGVFDDK